MRTILVVNMLYAFVLPIVEVFVAAYVMRNTNSPIYVAFYQLFMYIGVVATSFLNGFLLRVFNVKTLYALGILLSGISMFVMMSIDSLGTMELGLAGFSLGAASGFFWTNRYLLTLNNTNDDNRNYFFGLESFFFTVASITVPLVVGAFLVQIDGKEILGYQIDLNAAYRIVTSIVILLTVAACAVLWKGNFSNPKEKDFLYLTFCNLWKKMLLLSSLKGMVQGFLVTAPAILVMTFIGNEGSLGLIQGVSGGLTAILVYVLGRIAKPSDRLKIFIAGLLLFLLGTLFNAVLFSAVGVIVFVLCKVIFQPLFDLAYFPIMMKAIDASVKIEKKNEYAYILSHEFGLFLGRAFGLVLFILLATYVSIDFALKYALVIVAGLQMIAYPLAKNITKESNAV